MSDFRKGDVCTLQATVIGDHSDGDLLIQIADAGKGDDDQSRAFVTEEALTLLRRPVDLATCDLPQEVVFSGSATPMTMVARGGDEGWVKYADGRHVTAQLSDLRPADAPAPSSPPDRISVEQDAQGFWTCREARSGSPEYVRADLADAPPPVEPAGDVATLRAALTMVARSGKFQCFDDAAWDVVNDALASITPTCPPGHIMIGDRAVPEPMREVPPDVKTIYLVSTGSPALISSWRWYGNDGDKDRLRSGLIHSSEASARAHAEAIIALSAGEGV